MFLNNRTCISSSVNYMYSAFCISTCDVQTDCLNFTLLNMVMTPTWTYTHSVLIVNRPLHQSFISAIILITLVIRYHKISKHNWKHTVVKSQRNVSSICLYEKIHSYFGCICLTFLQCAFSNESSTCLYEKMQSYIGCREEKI